MIYIPFMLLPFSYFEVAGLRIIFFSVLAFFVAILYSLMKKSRVSVSPSFCALFVIVIFILLCGSATGDYSTFFAATIFFIFTYWYLFVSFDAVKKLEKLIKIYIFSVFITAIGLCSQLVAYKYLGIEFGRIELYGGGRTAFSWLWKDFSFLSIYLVSAIPLLYRRFSITLFLIACALLVFSSLATSARSGIAALIIFLTFYILKMILESLARMRMKKHLIPIVLLGCLMPILAVFILPMITGREMSLNSSGRLEDFILGFGFLSENILFGAMFDSFHYVESTSTIPHNVFLYFLIMGGITGLFLSVLWLGLILKPIFRADKRITSSILISFIGFQFVPSIFSAYFFAILLSLAFLSALSNQAKSLQRETT
jgi:O-antigen ligase